MLRWIARLLLRTNLIKGVFLGTVIIFFYLNAKLAENENFNSRRSAGKVNTKYVHHLTKKEDVPLPPKPVLQTHYNLSNPDWIEVSGSDRSVFLYSAYYDTRLGYPSVRLIAIIKKKFKFKECRIWTDNGTVIKTEVVLKSIRENWGLAYVAAFVICKGFKLKKNEVVRKVALSLPNAASLETTIDVIQLKNNAFEGDFSVCVKPFHYNYNRAVWLVEFVEFHRILGVNKFFFYNHTVGKDVEDALQHYIRQEMSRRNFKNFKNRSRRFRYRLHSPGFNALAGNDRKEWFQPSILPVLVAFYDTQLFFQISQTQGPPLPQEIRTEGIFAALNDCNLRNVGRYKYTIMIDLDEYIIPRIAHNYTDLIKSLGDKNVYVFQNVFFYLYWPNDTTASQLLYGSQEALGNQLFSSESEGPYLLTAYKTTRVAIPHKHGTRSKYITKPQMAIECGNHVVWETVGPRNSLNVNSQTAIVHHYRICEYGGFQCLKTSNLIDQTAHYWLPELVKRVAKTCSLVYQSKGTCPEAPPLGSPW